MRRDYLKIVEDYPFVITDNTNITRTLLLLTQKLHSYPPSTAERAYSDTGTPSEVAGHLLVMAQHKPSTIHVMGVEHGTPEKSTTSHQRKHIMHNIQVISYA